MKYKKTKLLAVTAVVAVVAGAAFLPGLAIASGDDDGHDAKKPQAQMPADESGKMMMPGAEMGRLKMPVMDPVRGRKLFTDKGCVACHSINGVGGEDAPALDARGMEDTMNPFEFAAKMWNHAPAMIAAQEDELGEQINFTGQELADIIAFVHNDDAQHEFSEDSLPAETREMMKGHGGSEGGGHGDNEGDGHDKPKSD